MELYSPVIVWLGGTPQPQVPLFDGVSVSLGLRTDHLEDDRRGAKRSTRRASKLYTGRQNTS